MAGMDKKNQDPDQPSVFAGSLDGPPPRQADKTELRIIIKDLGRG